MSHDDVQRLADRSAAPAATAAALGFMRWIQLGRADRAYALIAPDARRALPYARFQRSVKQSAWRMDSYPQLGRVRQAGATATVGMTFQQQPVLSREDFTVTLGLTREGGRWLLGGGLG